MNFCEESDLYISLYIDELLEDTYKEEFLKHLDECPQCAQKLKEQSFIAQMCKDDEEMPLPEDFSESLHSKLIEVSEKEYNNKKKIFIFNKKVMAALSTAAVVVISILAYNLLPDLGAGSVMDKTSSLNASVNESSAAGAPAASEDNADANIQFSGEIQGDEGSQTVAGAADSKGSANSSPSSQALQKAKEVEQVAPAADKSTSETSNRGEKRDAAAKKSVPDNNIKIESVPEGADSSNLKTTMCMAMADQTENAAPQYFTNYVEMNLSVSSAEAEMEKLKQFMSDLGAGEESSGMLNGFTANTNDASLYIEYSLPLSLYGSLRSEALLKYKLELKTKTDIIKNNITEQYNELTNKKIEIENKINEALIKGKDTSTFEAEKSTLIKKIDELTAKSHMITVRIFFVKK
ncbi:MAG: putative transrane anti-sigma factor [Eubacterium sp.]|jgi:hypothetical protein|nr:putative transrane anti-sigma factor [Eubacterium sp.]